MDFMIKVVKNSRIEIFTRLVILKIKSYNRRAYSEEKK